MICPKCGQDELRLIAPARAHTYPLDDDGYLIYDAHDMRDIEYSIPEYVECYACTAKFTDFKRENGKITDINPEKCIETYRMSLAPHERSKY